MKKGIDIQAFGNSMVAKRVATVTC